jgi:putative heme-binding domain-containing protein
MKSRLLPLLPLILLPGAVPAAETTATPLERIKAPKGFQVELLYSVPAAEQGSWVNLCIDGKGRILASDQYGALYRFPAPAPGTPLDPAKIEKIPADIRAVNGMVWAFGALYVAVNDYDKKMQGGVYRITDSDNDDLPDKVEQLLHLDARGDHGIHALVPTPDGKGLYLITGNSTTPAKFTGSKVPLHWGEDHLLPRMPDGRGFMRDTLAPGGIIYRISPDGKQCEVFSSGYRNIFDAAVNGEGELFTYDADMEYDFNTPWYRPTRVCHVTSGSEWGWRNGAGKWPEWYPDNLGPVVNIGPGSPTGMTFGYGAKFPAKYQRALFCLDWSWGKLYAVHLTPEGSGYRALKEEFLSGSPLPLTDALIHPADGAMYFSTGGRKVQSGLYRVTYSGSDSTAAAQTKQPDLQANRDLRHRLEAFHGGPSPEAVETLWPHLGSDDRTLRTAARIALEHQPVAEWSERALAEKTPAIQLEALLALAQTAGIDPLHRKPSDPATDTALGKRISSVLVSQDWSKLTAPQRLTLVRTLEIVFNRFGRPEDAEAKAIATWLDARFPSQSFEENWLLCETLVYLQSPTVAAKALALIENAPTQEEQMEYARSLRMLKTGWTPQTHTAYLEWFLKAANYKGGASFEKFIEFIRNDAIASLSEEEKTALAAVIQKKPEKKSALENLGAVFTNRTPTQWTLEELSAAAATGMKGRNFAQGRKMFGAAGCFVCHRFGNEGGMTGPDLTGAGGRYTPHDFLDQILNPSKEINEQFVPIVVKKTNGQEIVGTVVNLSGESVTLNTDPSDPNQRANFARSDVVSIEPSKVSPMPPMLLAMLNKEEILDLAAYVLSGGNSTAPAFTPSK